MRLARMSGAEAYDRAAQVLARRWDLLLSRLQIPLISDNSSPSYPFSASFFFNATDMPRILTALRQDFPQVVGDIIARADQVCKHRFNLLGYRDIDYGSEIDWHLDPIHGKRAPLRPWFQIPYLNFAQVGDAKIIWELNRHQHLTILAKAYRLTGEPEYAQELLRQWYQWQANNPYPFGINWASSLEVAFRSLSWIWVWYLLDGSQVISKKFGADLRRALMLNARHIERFLSTYFSTNTHLLGEAVGLFFIGTVLSQCRSAKHWQRLGWQIILREAQRQVQSDGMHFEQSLYYHVYALDFFLHARILASTHSFVIPQEFDQTIQRMLEVLANLAMSGPLQQFGDDDGGRLFDGARNRRDSLLDPLATGAALFLRSDFKAVTATIPEETIWLLGVERTRQLKRLMSQPLKPRSLALQASGIYAMCSSEPPSQLVIDAGPQGYGFAGHGHADALSLQLTFKREPVLIDPGTFVYVDEQDRNRFRETCAHNALVVDGSSQAEPLGPFKWRRLPNVRVQRWLTGSNFDLFSGSHDGYTRVNQPINHRRDVFSLHSHFWLIHDVICGNGTHDLDLFWHFAPGTLSLTASHALFTTRKHSSLGLLFTADQHWVPETIADLHSEAYGEKTPSLGLKLHIRTNLPTSIATLLLPLEQPGAPLGQFRQLDMTESTAGTSSYIYGDSSGFTHYILFADAPGPWQCREWRSDARFLHCAIAPDGAKHFTVCYGSQLDVAGRCLFHDDSVVPAATVFQRTAQEPVESFDAVALA